MTAAKPPPTLDQQLCFDLYAASRAVTSVYRPMLAALGLTYPQYLVMLVLSADGPSVVRDLAESLHLDHGTLTPLLRRMEKGGLVSRQRSSDDERLVTVTLTTKGVEVGAHLDDVQCQVKDVLGLSPQDFAALQATLRVVTARAEHPFAG